MRNSTKKLIFILILLAVFAALGSRMFENNKSSTISIEALSQEIPVYSDKIAIELNGNKPLFTKDEITLKAYEKYSDLDIFGRTQVAQACLSKELMPTEHREYTPYIRPTGWHTEKYPGLVEDDYLYNRCHLIAYTLTGENGEERDLITGTRYFNVEGMLPYEIKVSDYIRRTNNHVMYRVTPVYEGNDLLAKGVLMEALSVEDNGYGVEFCVFVYNIQPGIEIDYATGDSWRK